MLGTFRWEGQPYGIVPVLVRIRGAGAAAPAVIIGPHKEVVAGDAAGAAGITMNRSGAGAYTMVFPAGEPLPGRYMGALPVGHDHTTPTATSKKDVEINGNSFGSLGAKTLGMVVYQPATDAAAAAAADLTSAETLTLLLLFRAASPGA